jgi:chromosome segregation ATPase
MAISNVPAGLETRDRQDGRSQQTGLGGMTRVDSPHAMRGSAVEPSEAVPVFRPGPVADDAADQQIRLQADQLAEHLRRRQKDLDHREAALNSQIARLESETRAASLWLGERENELATRDEVLVRREADVAARAESLAENQREVGRRLARLAAAEVVQQKHAGAGDGPAQGLATDALRARRTEIEQAEARLAEVRTDAQQVRDQLADQRRAVAEELAAMRQQLTAERQQATADLQSKRQAVQRRADHVDQCQASLEQLRAEVGRMHRETLEIRLATEELRAQLSGAAPPAALTQSLGRIRAQLAEQYRQANAELADRRKELETVRSQLLQQHEALVKQKQQFEQWAAAVREECQQQASRLIARERLLRSGRFEPDVTAASV